MTEPAAPPPVQLLLYEFGPEGDFQGQIVGALERLESGGALRIVDVLFVHRQADGGELDIVDLKGDGAGGIAGPLLEFRLDEGARRRATQKALADRPGGLPAELLRELGQKLEPGGAIAAVLVDHVWRRTLEDAVSRGGGQTLVAEYVDVAKLAELMPTLLAARP